MKKEYLLRKHILFELFDFEGVRNQIIESRKWFVEDGILYNPKESESDYFDYVDIFTYSKKEFDFYFAMYEGIEFLDLNDWQFRENFSEWLENEIKSAKSYVGIKDRFIEYVKNNNKYIVHNSVKDFVARYIAENIDKCTNVESVNGLQLINDNDVFQMYNLPYVFQRKGVTA
jgi:hypothetical protein